MEEASETSVVQWRLFVLTTLTSDSGVITEFGLGVLPGGTAVFCNSFRAGKTGSFYNIGVVHEVITFPLFHDIGTLDL